MTSLWKKKLYTINRFNLINFSNIHLLQIEKKNIELIISNFKIVNRFIPMFNYLFSNNTEISIYNGKFFYIVKFNKNKVNTNYNINFIFKFGELSVTRRMGLIHKSKKKYKNLKKN